MERKSIITWMDAFKMAIGIMVGLMPALYIMKCSGKTESKSQTPNSITYQKVNENKGDTIFVDSYEECNYNPSINDILQMREELKYAVWVDSVYLTIPDSILIDILVNEGTQASVVSIVQKFMEIKEEK